jgi:hypothetical protein
MINVRKYLAIFLTAKARCAAQVFLEIGARALSQGQLNISTSQKNTLSQTHDSPDVPRSFSVSTVFGHGKS